MYWLEGETAWIEKSYDSNLYLITSPYLIVGLISSTLSEKLFLISEISELSNSIRLLVLNPPYGFVVLPGYRNKTLFACLKNKSEYEFFRPSPSPNKTIKIKIPRDTVVPDRTVLSLFFLIDWKIYFQRSILNIL